MGDLFSKHCILDIWETSYKILGIVPFATKHFNYASLIYKVNNKVCLYYNARLKEELNSYSNYLIGTQIVY